MAIAKMPDYLCQLQLKTKFNKIQNPKKKRKKAVDKSGPLNASGKVAPMLEIPGIYKQKGGIESGQLPSLFLKKNI